MLANTISLENFGYERERERPKMLARGRKELIFFFFFFNG